MINNLLVNCETLWWISPSLRSDTLKIKAVDLCSGGDSLPAWRAVLLGGLSVSGAVAACVHTGVCTWSFVHVSIYCMQRGSTWAPRVSRWGMSEAVWRWKLVLKIFTLPGLESVCVCVCLCVCVCVRVGGGGLWEWTWECIWSGADAEGAEVQTDIKQIRLWETKPRQRQPFLTLPMSYQVTMNLLLNSYTYMDKPSMPQLVFFFTFMQRRTCKLSRKSNGEVYLVFLNGIRLLCVWLHSISLLYCWPWLM